MRIVTMLLHDERFSGWSLREKLERFHFSKQYLRFCKSFGWEPYLYCFHQSVTEKQVYEAEDLGVIKVFPVKFRFPPFLRFGNDHNPSEVLKELRIDEPDLIHFHHYYLFSFPYMTVLIKRHLKCPLTAQLHGYNQKWWRRIFYLPNLLALKKVDRIFYSYKPEESVYARLDVLDKAVRVPMPSVDPKIFKPDRRKDLKTNLLYVGRIPPAINPYGEKSPILLLLILHRLLRVRAVNLTIVGDGAGLPLCKRLTRKLKLEKHVDFRGFLPRSELPNLYRRSMLTLVPIDLYDIDGFFDGSIQESLACATPVAAFKPSTSKPLEGTFGFLLTKDVEKAAEELSNLLDAPDLLTKKGLEGSSFVRNCCTENVLKERLRDEWEGLAKR